jgi:hypothetical protein
MFGHEVKVISFLSIRSQWIHRIDLMNGGMMPDKEMV